MSLHVLANSTGDFISWSQVSPACDAMGVMVTLEYRFSFGVGEPGRSWHIPEWFNIELLLLSRTSIISLLALE